MNLSTYSGAASGGQQLVAPWVELIEGDCLEEMAALPAGSVDMILCDLPYGTTQNKWDSVIPLGPLWAEYWRVCRGAVVLTAAQPFTSALVMSSVDDFKYEWMWRKSPSGNLNAKKMPMAGHESVLVFARGKPPYNPQGLVRAPFVRKAAGVSRTENYGAQTPKDYVQEFTNYPSTVLEFAKDRGLHPTQKPVALFEYLIKTYTNEGDTVLDCCAGSGTTGIAARNCGRNAILIEKDPTYYDIASERLWPAQKEAAQ